VLIVQQPGIAADSVAAASGGQVVAERRPQGKVLVWTDGEDDSSASD
jgi:hypothetical protein